jgi:hypothetical protein
MQERFQQLFVGGGQAHGEWERETGACKTLKAPASPQDYQDHVEGKRGLGLVPIREDGTCRFAAIDIDVDNIDHKALLAKVQKLRIPLTVCRSKSGGAHLYLFMADPGMPAQKVIVALKKWAALLGYPKAEIFPKQNKVTRTNLGNWINLPYFDGENTVRYAQGPTGSLSPEEFFESVVLWNGVDTVDATLTQQLVQIEEMPPCLACLTQEGLPEGGRNNGLFNFAVFYRKSSPNGWEEKVVQHNQLYVKPPLSNREVQTIIKSIGQRKYQYQCGQEPIASRCQRQACLALPYGVGHEPWKDGDNFDDLLVSHVRKILTDPPRYIVEVNGHDVELGTKEFLKFPAFRDRIFELLDVVVAPQKQPQWEQTIRDLLSKKEEIQAPEDASTRGTILSKVSEFLTLSERTKGVEDILKGYPVRKEDFVWFRVADLQRYFTHQKFTQINNQVLFQVLYSAGGTYASLRVKGKIVTAWKVPESMLNLQTDDFDQPDFNDVRNEL